ncbi:MAG TPA: polysaccharide deacetylase family protein [Kofleriaceae bacterium]|nr:polysaccharide deacetylase family protein [Kofleriaceae bacterium]
MSGPPSLHERVAVLLERTRLLEAALRARRYAPFPNLTIVTFHRLAEPADDEPYDPDVIDATQAQFRRHVEAIARFATPIDVETLVRSLDGGPLPPNPAMITFDDGYRSCRDIALPILRELGVPATFFIATAFASQRMLYWWEKIAAIVRLARGRRARVCYPRPLVIDTRHATAARRLLDDTIKNTHDLDIERFLGEVCTALEVPWSADLEAGLARGLVMSWDDVRALAAAGMDVESHTRTHRVLDTLSPAALVDELAGSRADLERQLGRPVRAIAYPVGRRPPIAIRHAAAEAGYRVGLTNASGVNRGPAWLLDAFDISRLSTERSQSDAMFLAQLAIPQLAFVNI